MKYLLSIVFLVLLTGCQSFREESSPDIIIDGSSTVLLIAELSIERYLTEEPDIRIELSASGTTNGLFRLCNGEVQIANASRRITEDERDICESNGVAFREMVVAKDGIAVVVNANNIWVDYFTVEELAKIWHASSEEKVLRWNDIRENWPDRPFQLYGPGSASGTYSYFSQAIVGETTTRGDYVASENDALLVQGVTEDPDGIGVFGLGYYKGDNVSIRLVPIDDGKNDNGIGPSIPSFSTIRNGTYQPLSRDMYVYITENSLLKEEVFNFADYFLNHASDIVRSAGYIPLEQEVYDQSRRNIRELSNN